MKQYGSQMRENLYDAGMRVYEWRPYPNEVVLSDNETGNLSIYTLNDAFAGHVIEIGGRGYEFVRDWAFNEG